MATSYKGFNQIGREANRRIGERKRLLENEKNNKQPWQITREQFINQVAHYIDIFGSYPSDITNYLKIVAEYESPSGGKNEFSFVKPSVSKGKYYAGIVHEALVKKALEDQMPIMMEVINAYPNLKKAYIMKTTNTDISTNALKKFASFLSRYKTIDGYMEEDENASNENADGFAKQNFKSLGKKAFQELAEYIGLTPYDVSFNPGGPAVSGDLRLMGMLSPDKGIYISLNKDGRSSGVLYRSITHMKDYSGGSNHYFPESDFNHPEKIKEKVMDLLKQNQPLTEKYLSQMNSLPNVSVLKLTDKGLENRKEKEFASDHENGEKSTGKNDKQELSIEKRKAKFLNEFDKAVAEKNYWKAGFVFNELYQEIIKGQYLELTPLLILKKDTPNLKKEIKHHDIAALLDSDEFRSALSTNLWNLIPDEYKKEPSPVKIVNWYPKQEDQGLITIIKEFLGHDDLRPAFLGAEFEKEGIIATDTMKLIFLNQSWKGKQGVYCLTKKCFDNFPKKDSPLDVSFPNYKAIIPFDSRIIITVQLSLLRAYCKTLQDAFKGSNIKVLIKYAPGQLISFQIDHLLDSIEAFLKLGFPEADFGFNAADKSVLITPVGKNAEAAKQHCPYVLLMPIKITVNKESELKKGIMYLDLQEQAIKTSGIKETIPLQKEQTHQPNEKKTIALSMETPAINSDSSVSLLMDDNWFKLHPEKILGEEYQTTDRFNKIITKVRGTIDNVIQGIDVPTLEIPQESNEALQTVMKEPLQQLMNDPEKKNNIERVIHQTKKANAEKALKKLSAENNKSLSEVSQEYFSFEQILKEYNKGITDAEIKAWIWYKRKTGGLNEEKVILNAKNGWSKYVVPLAESEKHLNEWLKQGVVCFYEGDYIPSVLYYAENIYERQNALLQEKDNIIKQLGKEQYDRQWIGLENIKPPRLSLTDTNLNERLFIKPDSAFAKETFIAQLSDGTKLQPSSYVIHKQKEDGVSLLEAFKTWLKALPTEEFKRSTEYNITNYYLEKRTLPRYYGDEEKLRVKQYAKVEGDRFFVRFLAEGLMPNDRNNIEQRWNAKYNAYVEINYFKVPVAFTCSSTFKNKPLFIRAAQREGIGFISVHGTGCIAYDVGVGKTMTAILSLAQALEIGQCKRPFIVVPNQTYNNWLNELRGVVENGKITLSGILPQYQIIELYNLSKEYLDPLMDEKGKIKPVPENTISVITYEGFNRLCFNEKTWNTVGSQLYDILNQGTDGKREEEKLFEKIKEMMGKGIRGGIVNIEELGLDYLVVDEAHAMKKSFTHVRGAIENGQREKSSYEIHSGEPSMTALRGFMISQYILRSNGMRNVQLLTATPFTNSPLEIYSMLSLIGYQQLENWGVKNIKDFFDTFIKTSIELTINSKLQPERKEIVLGFHNLIALQQLIYKFITYKTGEDAQIQRPNKIVLPLLNKREGDKMIPLPPQEQLSTNLPMTTLQKQYMKEIEDYVTGGSTPGSFCVNATGLEETSEVALGKSVTLKEKNLSQEELEGAKVLRGMTFARQLALSPFLYACNPRHDPSYTEYIETSPKLKYVMECIQSVKKFHEDQHQEVSGQVIYMNAGVHFFPLIKEYLIKKIGFLESEVGIISSGVNRSKKEGIKERFLAGGVKVIIGSATIKEGINLQNRTTVLYNCWLDWNPTDVKQLEGRIWRYGNIYANVRIVNPLMEDSIDMFIFQKLEEKTSRINEIWYRAGKTNALNLEEFNPAELKMGLVTNPRILAELVLMEEKERMQDEISSIRNQRSLIEQIHNQRTIFNDNIEYVKTMANKYRPPRGGAKPRSTENYFKIFGDWLDDENMEHTYKDEDIYYSTRSAFHSIEQALEEILAPRGLDIGFDQQKLFARMDKEVENIKQKQEEKTGKEAVEAKANEIIADRKKKGYQRKTVEQRAAEFATLNPKLLSEMMVYDQSQENTIKRNVQIEKGKELEESADTLDELETLVRDMEEMDLILSELEELQKAA